MRLMKYKDLYNKTPIVKRMTFGGEFRCILRDLNGRVLRDTGWFPNLITDSALTQFGSQSSPWTRYLLGSGATAPAFTDTALVAQLGTSTTATPAGNFSSNSGSPLYMGSQTQGRRFNAGVATGTIREIGIDGGSGNLNVRALVSPEIVKASDQVLDIWYRFNVYPDLTDTSGTVTIDSVSYDYVCRHGFVIYCKNTMTQFRANLVSYLGWVSNGTIGAYTGDITGTVDSSDAQAYVANGSGYYDWYSYWGLDSGNVSGGISAARSRITIGQDIASNVTVQTSLAATVGGAKVPKDNTKTFRLDWRLTWARH